MARLFALLAFIALVQAQTWQLGGSLTGRYGVFYSDLALSEPQVQAQLVLSGGVEDADFWLELLAGTHGFFLGEAYLEGEISGLHLRIGRIRVDAGLPGPEGPLDAFNPKDFSYPPEPKTLPNEALELQADGFYAAYAPLFKPSVAPEGRWAKDPNLPDGVVRLEVATPAPLFENGVFALGYKNARAGAAILYTYTPFPQLKLLLDANDPGRPCQDPNKGPCLAVMGYDRLLLAGSHATFGWETEEGPLSFAIETALGVLPALGLDSAFLEVFGALEQKTKENVHIRFSYRGRLPLKAPQSHRVGILAKSRPAPFFELSAGWEQDLVDASGALYGRGALLFGENAELALYLSAYYGAPQSHYGQWGDNGELGLAFNVRF